MNEFVSYRQLNKDYAYWIEKRWLGQQRGGQVAGLISHVKDERVRQHILFDTGLGTLEALADFCPEAFWDESLLIFITHGHIDHHAELMILSEIYCQRRGQHIRDFRPPLHIFCTPETQKHLYQTHYYGYTGGKSLHHVPVIPGEIVQAGIFNILPLSVDHFEGAVIYVIEFNLSKPHKIVIGWDTTTLPLAYIEQLYRPSLALFEATTWGSMVQDTGHSSLEDLVKTGFLERLGLDYQPAQERYGAYLVHYSGREDPWGMLTDQELKEKFDVTFPLLSNFVRVAERGQQWKFG